MIIAPARLRRCVERLRRDRFCGMQVLGDYNDTVISHISDGFIASVSGETIEPASASGVDERLLAAPLVHMRRIPRRVLATRPEVGNLEKLIVADRIEFVAEAVRISKSRPETP
jgi:hypothetical protein